jgi:hypothetical protein
MVENISSDAQLAGQFLLSSFVFRGNGADGVVAYLGGRDEIVVNHLGGALEIDDAGFGALALVPDVQSIDLGEVDRIALGVDKFDLEHGAVEQADQLRLDAHLHIRGKR